MNTNQLKYLVIGAGGTGGPIGAYMTESGKDITLIARGSHLSAIQKNGLKMETTLKGNYTVDSIKAADMDNYDEQPDVIFVCVKGYSLKDTIPFIRKVIKPSTIIIPILNIYGTGAKLQEYFPGNLVTDGCIYVAAQIREPGTIWMNGDIFRIVFGPRTKDEYNPLLETIKNDLDESGIAGLLTDHVQRDCLKKFSYVSAAAGCGQYFDAEAGMMQNPGEIRDTFAAMIGEIDILAKAMGIEFDIDIVATNLDILDHLSPSASTSMQRDIKAGKPSEIDGLVYEVVRLAKRYEISLPTYEKVANELQQRGLK